MCKQGMIQCPECLGTGHTAIEDPEELEKCYYCNGEGEVFPVDDEDEDEIPFSEDDLSMSQDDY